jgi:hypothetical protein
MKTALAIAIGYVIGAKTGDELDELGRSLKTLRETEEFADVVSAARAQVANALRHLAAAVDGEQGTPELGGDIVARVRHLVGRE